MGSYRSVIRLATCRSQSSTHIRSRLASDFETRSNSARLAVAREQLPPRGVEIEQQLAPRRVADEAARPADRGEPRAARHVGDVVERGRRIGDERSGGELDGVLAGRALDHELAAVVALRVATGTA